METCRFLCFWIVYADLVSDELYTTVNRKMWFRNGLRSLLYLCILYTVPCLPSDDVSPKMFANKVTFYMLSTTEERDTFQHTQCLYQLGARLYIYREVDWGGLGITIKENFYELNYLNYVLESEFTFNAPRTKMILVPWMGDCFGLSIERTRRNRSPTLLFLFATLFLPISIIE